MPNNYYCANFDITVDENEQTHFIEVGNGSFQGSKAFEIFYDKTSLELYFDCLLKQTDIKRIFLIGENTHYYNDIENIIRFPTVQTFIAYVENQPKQHIEEGIVMCASFSPQDQKHLSSACMLKTLLDTLFTIDIRVLSASRPLELMKNEKFSFQYFLENSTPQLKASGIETRYQTKVAEDHPFLKKSYSKKHLISKPFCGSSSKDVKVIYYADAKVSEIELMQPIISPKLHKEDNGHVRIYRFSCLVSHNPNDCKVEIHSVDLYYKLSQSPISENNQTLTQQFVTNPHYYQKDPKTYLFQLRKDDEQAFSKRLVPLCEELFTELLKPGFINKHLDQANKSVAGCATKNMYFALARTITGLSNSNLNILSKPNHRDLLASFICFKFALLAYPLFNGSKSDVLLNNLNKPLVKCITELLQKSCELIGTEASCDNLLNDLSKYGIIDPQQPKTIENACSLLGRLPITAGQSKTKNKSKKDSIDLKTIINNRKVLFLQKATRHPQIDRANFFNSTSTKPPTTTGNQRTQLRSSK